MAGRETLSKTDYEALAAFRLALRKFLRFSEAAAGARGITPQQYQALLAIKGFPGRERITVRELSDQLQIKHHSAVGLVDRLAAERLVSREPSPEDRRCILVCLTTRGQQILGNLAAAHSTQLRRMSPEIRRLLQRLGKDAPPIPRTALA